MKKIFIATLLGFSSVANAGLVSGAVGGAVGGAIVASATKPNKSPSAVKENEMKVGNTLLLCRLTIYGKCDAKNSFKSPLAFAAESGFTKVHRQTYSKCENVYGDYCIIMEVSE